MASKNGTEVTIKAPNMKVVTFIIRGTTPYVQNKFSARIKQDYKAKQEAGSTGRSKRIREAKDFQRCFEEAQHISEEGWWGIPAPAFRNAMVSACRTVGFKMTLAKLSVFVEADGFDADDNTPLVKITKGEPQYSESVVRNETGVIDLRARPLWKPGWEATVKVRYDADQFATDDIANLMLRVGCQVGIGEGRPDSKKSTGMGWGLFEVVND